MTKKEQKIYDGELAKQLKELCSEVGYDSRSEAHKVVGDKIIFVEYYHDDLSINPLEDCDGLGKIYSFSIKHVNCVRDQAHANELVKTKGAVILSYFEHGNCIWGVQGTMEGMPDFQWDGVSGAGVWVPDEHIPEDADMRKEAKIACDLYTKYCNGEVYGFNVKIFNVRKEDDEFIYDEMHDYRRDEPVFEEGCGGFYGREHAEEDAASLLLYWAKEEGLIEAE